MIVFHQNWTFVGRPKLWTRNTSDLASYLLPREVQPPGPDVLPRTCTRKSPRSSFPIKGNITSSTTASGSFNFLPTTYWFCWIIRKGLAKESFDVQRQSLYRFWQFWTFSLFAMCPVTVFFCFSVSLIWKNFLAVPMVLFSLFQIFWLRWMDQALFLPYHRIYQWDSSTSYF